MAGSGGFRPSLVRSGSGIGPEASVLASEHGLVKRVGITVDSTKVEADEAGNKVVPVGTILVKDSVSGKYAPYVAEDPIEDTDGILTDASINLRHGDVITGITLHGSVLEARIKNLTPAAKTALSPRIIFQ